MRVAGAVLVASITALAAPALLGGVLTPQFRQRCRSQTPTADSRWRKPPRRKAPTAKKDTPAAKKGAPAPPPPPGAYATMPLAERVGIQFDLAWTGYYNGLINGEFNDKSIAAVRAFQKATASARPACWRRRSAPCWPPGRRRSRSRSAGAWSTTRRPARRSACRPSRSPTPARARAAPAGPRRKDRCRSRPSASASRARRSPCSSSRRRSRRTASSNKM